MMTDRFDAQLREHLLASANSSSPDGQLAGISQGVAGTKQRHPLAARLTWFPGRIGPVPTDSFRYALVAVALIAAMVATVIIVGNGLGRSTVFEGTWTSIDSGDGSAQSLVVAAGKTPAMHFVDHYASGFACRNDDVKVFTADGLGTITDNRLAVTWPNGGGCGLETVDIEAGTYTYDKATDTMVDDQGLVWVRADEPPPTRGPATGPPPTGAPEPTTAVGPLPGQCGDVAAGATYRAVVGPLTLSAAIPAEAAITWETRGVGFSLVDFCSDILASSGPYIGASMVTYVDGSCVNGDTVEVTTPTEVNAALASVTGVAMGEPSSVSLAGRAATRFEIQPDARMCFDVVPLWDGFEVGRGRTIIYVVDVDGLPLAITITDTGGPGRAAGIAEAEAIVASLQIEGVSGAQPSREPVPTADAGCIQLDGTGSYTAPVGSTIFTATVPDDPGTTWSGSRDWFRLLRSPCGYDAALTFETQIVTRVAVDACRGLGDSVEVRSAAEAATALADQASTDVTERTDITIDGRPAVRFLITVPGVDTFACDEGAALLLGQTGDDPFIRIDPGYTMVHLVDVDGSILAITAVLVTDDGTLDPALTDAIDAIIGALRIGG